MKQAGCTNLAKCQEESNWHPALFLLIGQTFLRDKPQSRGKKIRGETMGCHQEAASSSTRLPSATDINPSRGCVSQTMYQGHQAWEDNGLVTLGKSRNTARLSSYLWTGFTLTLQHTTQAKSSDVCNRVPEAGDEIPGRINPTTVINKHGCGWNPRPGTR